jgi:hypothetical protein
MVLRKATDDVIASVSKGMLNAIGLPPVGPISPSGDADSLGPTLIGDTDGLVAHVGTPASAIACQASV